MHTRRSPDAAQSCVNREQSKRPCSANSMLAAKRWQPTQSDMPPPRQTLEIVGSPTKWPPHKPHNAHTELFKLLLAHNSTPDRAINMATTQKARDKIGLVVDQMHSELEHASGQHLSQIGACGTPLCPQKVHRKQRVINKAARPSMHSLQVDRMPDRLRQRHDGWKAADSHRIRRRGTETRK